MDRRNDMVDEYGFPIQVGFDGRPERRAQAGPRLSVRWLIVLTMLIFAAAVGAAAGPAAAARYFSWKALERERRGDVPGAVDNLDYAIYWSKSDANAFLRRGRLLLEWREREDAAAQAVADFEQYRRMSPEDTDVHLLLAHALQWRALQVPEAEARDMHRRAVDLASTALSHQPESISLLNSRAYIRAVAKLELPGALEDIDLALKLLGESAASDPDDLLDLQRRADVAADLEYQSSRCAYLDTRGYILLQLNRCDEALGELDAACKLADELAAREAAIYAEFNAPPAFTERMARRWRDTRAVLIHHRGETRQALGQAAAAEADFNQAKELGFDPAAGVF